jgi:hypothetical protein
MILFGVALSAMGTRSKLFSLIFNASYTLALTRLGDDGGLHKVQDSPPFLKGRTVMNSLEENSQIVTVHFDRCAMAP